MLFMPIWRNGNPTQVSHIDHNLRESWDKVKQPTRPDFVNIHKEIGKGEHEKSSSSSDTNKGSGPEVLIDWHEATVLLEATETTREEEQDNSPKKPTEKSRFVCCEEDTTSASHEAEIGQVAS
jgi:hypothetical protein